MCKRVGVDLNTASPSLLSYVAGINKTVSKNIITYREENGKFNTRKELLKVPKLGAKAFEQCAGFLRITDGDNVLDNTSVHPESYKAAAQLLKHMGYTEQDVQDGTVADLKQRLSKENTHKLAEELGIGEITLKDIADSIIKKGREPREELRQPGFKKRHSLNGGLKTGYGTDGNGEKRYRFRCICRYRCSSRRTCTHIANMRPLHQAPNRRTFSR